MKQAYIIGSVSRAQEIRDIAIFIQSNTNFNVQYVKKDPRNITVLIAECYDKIERADIVIAVAKDSDVFGNGTLYEIEYAKRCLKPILYTNGTNLSQLLEEMHLLDK